MSIFIISKNLNWINKINQWNNKSAARIYLQVNMVRVFSENIFYGEQII